MPPPEVRAFRRGFLPRAGVREAPAGHAPPGEPEALLLKGLQGGLRPGGPADRAVGIVGAREGLTGTQQEEPPASNQTNGGH